MGGNGSNVWVINSDWANEAGLEFMRGLGPGINQDEARRCSLVGHITQTLSRRGVNNN